MVRRLLACVTAASISIASPTPTSGSINASEFTGIYLRRGDSWVDYFQLTEVGGGLSGFYTILNINVHASGGVEIDRAEVSGTAERGVASLRTGRGTGIFSAAVGTASVTRTGLTLRAPGADGGIVSTVYRRVSEDDVNAEVGAFRRKAAYVKKLADELARQSSRLKQLNEQLAYLRQVQSDLAATLREVAQLEGTHARLLSNVSKLRQDSAATKLALDSARTVSARAREAADQAQRAATTSEQQQQANTLQVAADRTYLAAELAWTRASDLQNKLEEAEYNLSACEYQLREARSRATADSSALKAKR